jgi:Flp pilus assembly protein TadG
MNYLRNEKGSVLVFITLMVVLLLVMVGMGLDTGHLAYVRSTGQPAVDAAALAAASAVPGGVLADVQNRAAVFNATNTFQGSNDSQYRIKAENVTLVTYDDSTSPPTVTKTTDITKANGARVALENTNPYGGTVNRAMKSPLFLTPLFNLMGVNQSGTQEVSVSAVAVVRGIPGLPVAIEQSLCDTTKNPYKIINSSSVVDNSGYTSYWINNTSKTVLSDMIDNNYTCDSIPPVGVGFCTQLNNGKLYPLYNEFETFFKANSSSCYFIPVVKNGSNWNQCEKITQFAQFCPIDSPSGGFGYGKTKSADGKGWDEYLYGNLTCGETPYTTKDTKCYVPTLVRDTKSGM